MTALQEIDLQIEPGEFVSLIGPSGCGKSTLLRLIGDLTPPTERHGRGERQDARRRRALDHDYGMVFQDSVLFDWRTVAKNVALPLEMLGWDRAKRKAARRGDAAASSSCRASATTTRGSSPAACRCASRSRARSRSSRRCS